MVVNSPVLVLVGKSQQMFRSNVNCIFRVEEVHARNYRAAGSKHSFARLTLFSWLANLLLTSNRNTLRRNTKTVTANVPSLPILATLMMEAIRSSETSA
jgi:hypothetical protein